MERKLQQTNCRLARWPLFGPCWKKLARLSSMRIEASQHGGILMGKILTPEWDKDGEEDSARLIKEVAGHCIETGLRQVVVHAAYVLIAWWTHLELLPTVTGLLAAEAKQERLPSLSLDTGHDVHKRWVDLDSFCFVLVFEVESLFTKDELTQKWA